MRPKKFSIGQKVTPKAGVTWAVHPLSSMPKIGEIYTVAGYTGETCACGCDEPYVILDGLYDVILQSKLDPVDMNDEQLEEALKEVDHQPVTI